MGRPIKYPMLKHLDRPLTVAELQKLSGADAPTVRAAVIRHMDRGELQVRIEREGRRRWWVIQRVESDE